MTKKPKPERRVSLVRSSYQPSKKELEKPVEFPKGITPDELAEAVVQPVKINWKEQPE